TRVYGLIVIRYSERVQARTLWARSGMSYTAKQELHLRVPARRLRAHKGSQVSQQDD
ncbi:hypothetical protein Cfor_11803, partial [Coptotermes formosanus]